MAKKVLLAISFGAVAISLVISLFSQNWMWFSRSGSIMTFTAILLNALPDIRKADTRHTSNLRKDRESPHWAFGLLAVGALIWGYGDLLNKDDHSCKCKIPAEQAAPSHP